jgi:hypothetical protein
MENGGKASRMVKVFIGGLMATNMKGDSKIA